MKRICSIATVIAFFVPCILNVSCKNEATDDASWLKHGLEVAEVQILSTAKEYCDTSCIPCSVSKYFSWDDWSFQIGQSVPEDAAAEEPFEPEMYLGAPVDWRSGFFPGSLWELYKITGKEEFKDYAVTYTNKLNAIRYVLTTHDLGFMSMPSYGNAFVLSPDDTIAVVLKQCADNLVQRFNPNIGCIRSWGKIGESSGKWNYPVIIDNMMNLELMFEASKHTGDPQYKDIAVSHALNTIKNHYREDNTTFHVVSYNDDGTVQCKDNHQGKCAGSRWARGQAWGLYGFTMSYRETGDKRFLDQAVKVAKAIMENVKTEDYIPKWDWDAPDSDKTPRDASAAAVTASAMFELSTFAPQGKKYFKYAENILKSLSSPEYLAEPGTNFGFFLKHSATSVIGRKEVDAPLSYADYYYLEAARRYIALKGIDY